MRHRFTIYHQTSKWPRRAALESLCRPTCNMSLRCVPSLLNIFCNTFHLSANRLLPRTRAFNSAYALVPAAVGLARRNNTMSESDLAQHEAQSTIHANEKLVGQSGRHYLIERVLQSKEDPPAHVYLATWVSNKLCCQPGKTYWHLLFQTWETEVRSQDRPGRLSILSRHATGARH